MPIFTDLFYKNQEQELTHKAQQEISEQLCTIYGETRVIYSTPEQFEICKKQLIQLLDYYFKLCPKLQLFEEYKQNICNLTVGINEADKTITLNNAKQTLEQLLLNIQESKGKSIDAKRFNDHIVNACYMGAYSNLMSALTAFTSNHLALSISNAKKNLLSDLAAHFILTHRLTQAGNEIHWNNALLDTVANEYGIAYSKDNLTPLAISPNLITYFKLYLRDNFDLKRFIQSLCLYVPHFPPETILDADQTNYQQESTKLNEFFLWLGNTNGPLESDLLNLYENFSSFDGENATYKLNPRPNFMRRVKLILMEYLIKKGYVERQAAQFTLTLRNKIFSSYGNNITCLSNGDYIALQIDALYQPLNKEEIITLLKQRQINQKTFGLTLMSMLDESDLIKLYTVYRNPVKKQLAWQFELSAKYFNALLEKPSLCQETTQYLLERCSNTQMVALLSYIFTHHCGFLLSRLNNSQNQYHPGPNFREKALHLLSIANNLHYFFDYAIKHGLAEQLNYMITYKKIEISLLIQSKQIFPLHKAIASASPITCINLLCRLLWELKENLNDENTHGDTPALIAAQYGQIEVLKALQKFGANLQSENSQGKTPAVVAAAAGQINVLKTLQALGVNLHCETQGYTLALVAAASGQIEVLETLQMLGVNINSEAQGYTPALVAAATGQINVLSKLQELGVNLERENTRGKTPALIAAKYNQLQVLSKLQEWKVNLSSENTKGITPALIATKYGQTKVLRKLHALQIDPNGKNSQDFTPALLAASMGKLGILRELAGLGVNLNSQNSRGQTPAHIAVAYGQIAVLNELKNLGVKYLIGIEIPGTVPLLHIAVQQNNLDMVKYLLNEGADPTAQDKDGITPIALAKAKGYIQILMTMNSKSSNRKEKRHNTESSFFNNSQHQDETKEQQINSSKRVKKDK